MALSFRIGKLPLGGWRPRLGLKGNLFLAFSVIAAMAILISAAASILLGRLGHTMADLSGRDRRAAHRLRGAIGTFFRYAIVTLRAETAPSVVLQGALLQPQTQHRASIADEEELGALTRSIDEPDGWPTLRVGFGAPGAQHDEARRRAARWEARVRPWEGRWRVPAERMKARRDHRVPLSGAAAAVLDGVAKLRPEGDAKGEAFIFPGARRGRPLSQMAMLMLLRRMGRGDLTAHGFRSTFRDWCAESTNYPRELAEAALAHTLKDKTEAAYQRGDLMDKRRRLMAEWATFCARPGAATGGDVVAFRAAG